MDKNITPNKYPDLAWTTWLTPVLKSFPLRFPLRSNFSFSYVQTKQSFKTTWIFSHDKLKKLIQTNIEFTRP